MVRRRIHELLSASGKNKLLKQVPNVLGQKTICCRVNKLVQPAGETPGLCSVRKNLDH